MGTKFANMHIKGAEIQTVELILKQSLPKQNKYLGEAIDFFKKKDNMPSDLLNEILGAIGQEMCYKLGKVNPNWVTVLNSSFEFETIEKTAKGISKQMEGIFLAIGYFDDDVFIMCVVKEGKTLTNHISGPGINSYKLKPNLGNIELMIKELDLPVSNDELRRILEMKDIQAKVGELEKVLQLPLWIKSEWLDDMDSEIIHKFIDVE